MRRRNVSGIACVKILVKQFGFTIKRQTGSHIVLRKETPKGAIGTVVPNHKELKTGTLKGVLRLAHVDEKKVFHTRITPCMRILSF